MKKITLNPDKHRNKNIVSIQFGYDNEIKSHLKKLETVFWSQTIRSFYTDLSLENIRTVFNHLKTKNWSVDYSHLKNEIEKLRIEEKRNSHISYNLSKNNKIELQKFKKWLLQKRLSENTVNTYLDVTTTYVKFAIKIRTQLFGK